MIVMASFKLQTALWLKPRCWRHSRGLSISAAPPPGRLAPSGATMLA
jgi:hypothetical protein